MPQPDKSRMMRRRKNQVLCFIFRNRKAHPTTQASNKTANSHLDMGQVKIKMMISAAHATSESKNHFDMFRNLGRAIYYM